jgi:hypothetical protein
MRRSFLPVICGVVASLLLITFFEWLKWRVIPYFIFHRETSHLTTDQIWQTGEWGRYLAKYGGDLPKLTWQAFWWHKLLFNPVITLGTSVLVGLLAQINQRRAGMLAVISLIPFFLHSLVQPNFYFLWAGLVFCIPYILLSYLAAFITVRWRKGRQFS